MSVNFHYFDRANPQYPQDTIYLAKPSHHFQGNVTDAKHQTSREVTPKLVRVIDDAVVVESVDEKTRQAALNHFTNLQQAKSSDETKQKNIIYGSVATTVLGVGLAIGCPLLLPLVAPTIICATTGVGLSILGIWKTVNANQSLNIVTNELSFLSQAKNQWKDPADIVMAHRQNVKTQGFQYALKKLLKGTIVHSKEVQALWLHDFSKLLNTQQTLKQVCEENLLGIENVLYAWDRERLPTIELKNRVLSPAMLEVLSNEFRTCRQHVLDFECSINHELASLDQNKNHLKNEINNQRVHWLFPAECLYQQNCREADLLLQDALKPFIEEKNCAIAKVKQAYCYETLDTCNLNEMEYKNKLERLCLEEIDEICCHYDNHPAVMSIIAAHQQDRKMATFLHKQSQLLVNNFFDNRLRQLENGVNFATTQIEKQRSQGNHYLKNIMNKILTVSENELCSLHYTIPYVQRHWQLPLLTTEPIWGDVYGQAPVFQTAFRSEVSELAWNLFWSNKGLGRFASCPTSAWKQMPQDSASFLFRDKGFNLHKTVHRPSSGMFMREVKVPRAPDNIGTRSKSRPINANRQEEIKESSNQPNSRKRVTVGYGGTSRR